MRTFHVAQNLCQCPFLGACQPIGQGLADPALNLAGTLNRPTAQPFHTAPDKGQGKLVGQQFVIGQALAGPCNVCVGDCAGPMCIADGRSPVGKVLFRLERPVKPFRQIGNVCQNLFDRVPQRLAGQSRGQGIDWLAFRQAFARVRINRMIGVGHL